MSKPRAILSQILNGIEGVRKAYFQPPASVQMVYPCIRYSKASPATKHADNMRYFGLNRYNLIVIDKDPDSEIPQRILDAFDYCSIDRVYTADNLNHTSMTLYF